MSHQQMHRTKPPPVEMGHLANQINAMPVAPAAESQKREIVAKLNDLAAQMKHWAAQVEGFASHLNTLSVHASSQKYSGASSPNDPQYSRGGPPSANGQYANYGSPSTQHYGGSPQYQFQVQQPYSQSGRPLSASAEYAIKVPNSATPEEGEKQGKRRRRTDSTRRKKDPLAPKRPPSAYILYQNDVRKQMQDKYPDMPYTEVLGKISESWQTLEEGKKKVYLDLVERDKARYEDEKLRYNSGQEVPLKPTPRRPLAALRAPSDPDVDAEAEGEPEPDAEDAEEDLEEPEQEEHEQPDAKRTRLEGGPHPSVQTPNYHGYSGAQRQTPVPGTLSIQQPPQYPPQSAQQLQYTQHVTPYPNTQARLPPPPPSPHAQPPRASPHPAHLSPQVSHASPQARHISPQSAHLSPQAAHASPQPRTSPAAGSPHVSHASPQPHHMRISPQLAHVPSPVNVLQMPHLTHPQPAALSQVPQHPPQPGMGMNGPPHH